MTTSNDLFRHSKVKRSLSQNFLTDKYVLKAIKDIFPDMRGSSVIEIGPGKGALTELIYSKGPKTLNLIEKDKMLIPLLKETFPAFNIINEDIEDYDINEEIAIGAIPYSNSRSILKKCIETRSIKECYFIVQKEFGEKIIKEKIKPISIYSNTYFVSKKLLDIGRNSFFPVPGVDSMLLHMSRIRDLNESDKDYWTFINKLSVNKRKKVNTILNNNDDRRICHLHAKDMYKLYADINIYSH